jgi:tripartite-type tricarboxylate transporter receptor subunit TctC
MTSIFRKIAASLALALAASCALAQSDYPARQLGMVVAYPAGGAVDAVGRILAQHLADGLGKPVVVDNRSGASGNIGAQYVARAAADGYTLLMAPVTSYAMNGVLYPAMVGYNLGKDFAPIAVVGYLPLVLVANEAVPAATAAQLVQLAKAKPGGLSYGSSGNGSIEHVAGEMFKKQAGVSLLHIPYRGAAPAMTDVMSGQIQLMFATAPTAMANLRSGRIKPLMVATASRISTLAEVPTAKEAGLGNLEVGSTYAVFAPAGTPPAVVQRLNREIVKTMQLPDVRTRFQTLGIEPRSSSPEEATRTVADEMAKWSRAIGDANIKPDQ